MNPTSTLSAFRHEALLYSGLDGFVAGVAPFVAEAVDSEEAVLVVVDVQKIEALKAALGAKASAVHFADMAVVGRNPGRIIPAWQDFVDEHRGDGHSLRGVGEPIAPSRSEDELAECHRHEALLNVAFADSPPWWLLCPYDASALSPDVIAEARHNHPFVARDGEHEESRSARLTEDHARPFTDPLVPLPKDAVALEIHETAELATARSFVTEAARAMGVNTDRASDVALVVGELAANSMRHAHTSARIAGWSDGRSFVCEVRDGGRITDPLAGRRRPTAHDPGGRGLWIANQLSDLVQQRTVPDGNVVRVHFRIAT